jgi:hypothetical protein
MTDTGHKPGPRQEGQQGDSSRRSGRRGNRRKRGGSGQGAASGDQADTRSGSPNQPNQPNRGSSGRGPSHKGPREPREQGNSHGAESRRSEPLRSNHRQEPRSNPRHDHRSDYRQDHRQDQRGGSKDHRDGRSDNRSRGGGSRGGQKNGRSSRSGEARKSESTAVKDASTLGPWGNPKVGRQATFQPKPQKQPPLRNFGLLIYDSFAAAKADLAGIKAAAQKVDQLNIVIRAEGPMDDPELTPFGKVFAGAAWTLIHERRKADGWYEQKH